MGMSLEEFVSSVQSENEERFRELEQLTELLERLQQREPEIYIVSVQSNQ